MVHCICVIDIQKVITILLVYMPNIIRKICFEKASMTTKGRSSRFSFGDTLDFQCNLPEPQQPINIQQFSAALVRLCHAFFMPYTFIDFAHLSMDFNYLDLIILGYALSKIEEILKIKQDVFVL